MRRVGAVAAPAARGRDYVELYFDPDGKDNIVDCIVEEGYYLIRDHGTGMELVDDTRTDLGCDVEPLLVSRGSPTGDSDASRSKPSPMAMVNSALSLLMAES
jgi:hypothetical protein